MVTHQLQIRRRPGKVRRSETDILPTSYATELLAFKKKLKAHLYRHAFLAEQLLLALYFSFVFIFVL